MKLSINQFLGELPVIASHLLPEQNATSASNGRLEGGSLVPIKDMVASGFDNPAGNVKSWAIYPFDKTKVLTRTDNANFVRAPIANDAWQRVYMGGDVNKPQVAYWQSGNLIKKHLGVKKPNTPSIDPSYEPNQTPPSPDDVPVRAAWYVTNVSELGEESEPSDPTGVYVRWDGASVPLILGANNDPNAATRRIYRTEGGGEFNFVIDIPVGTTTYNDTINSNLLGAPCPSETWNAPPEKLIGMTMAGNGFMAAFFGNTLCFCEPYHPHAWPLDYQLAFPNDIVSVANVNGSLIVTTKAEPWVVSGTHPSAMMQVSLDIMAAGLSTQGHVDMGDHSLYPTNEGLMLAANGQIRVISDGIFSRDQWQALNPSKFKAFRYRGRYVCFGGSRSFIFDLENGVFFFDMPDEVLAGHYQADEDKLYLLVKEGSTVKVKLFDAGNNLTMTWESKEFQGFTESVFSCARVDADQDVTFTLTGDNYSFTHTVSNDKGFRLPSGRPRKLQIKLESAGRINTVTLASNMSELLP